VATKNTVTKTISVKEAKKELRRIKKLSRRGPLAGYRMAVASGIGVIVAGSDLLRDMSGDPTRAALRFLAGALLGWVTWGVVDSVLASVNRGVEAEERANKKRSREEEIARKILEEVENK
jgi:hypothetical protein